MRCCNLLVPVMALAAGVAALAQTPTYNKGRTPTQEEIRARDIAIGPEGKELPPGSGTAKEGAKIYAQKCAYCHGPTGAEDVPGAANLWPYPAFIGTRPVRPLVGGKGTLASPDPLRTIGSFWQVATSIWDYINRTMPPKEEGTFSADELYALTAFLLYRNDIIQETDVIDAQTLPKIQMPNRNGFVPPRPEWNPRETTPFRKASP
ncbi:MAG: cytochrome c [Acidobacteria bacterium]|nr:cytochrome c [Acidobacteriota bacterium]